MENLFGEKVAPKASPIAPYLGGKNLLADRISALIEMIDHHVYVEVFFGMGGVFFRRKIMPRAEVINDVNNELVTLFRVLRNHPAALIDELSLWLASRAEFDALKNASTEHMTDIQRAARFYFLQRQAFGGKAFGQAFGIPGSKAAMFDARKHINTLNEAHERLQGVTIENLDWQEVIKRYDTPSTLFYLDPPYWGGENDYGKGIFQRSDFAKIASVLADLEGKFILSINDVSEIRKLFSDFKFEEAELNYSISSKEAKAAKELIVTG